MHHCAKLAVLSPPSQSALLCLSFLAIFNGISITLPTGTPLSFLPRVFLIYTVGHGTGMARLQSPPHSWKHLINPAVHCFISHKISRDGYQKARADFINFKIATKMWETLCARSGAFAKNRSVLFHVFENIRDQIQILCDNRLYKIGCFWPLNTNLLEFNTVLKNGLAGQFQIPLRPYCAARFANSLWLPFLDNSIIYSFLLPLSILFYKEGSS